VPILNDEYIERMEDVLDVYAKPYSSDEPVVCLDEKPIQLHGHKRPTQVAGDGVRRRDYEYVRRGTANIFVAVEPKGGRHHLKLTPTRDRFEFARMLHDISKKYPQAKKLHLVLDNLSTHSRKALVDTFGENRAASLWKRFEFHFTPKHGSWLNQAEIGISLLSRESLGKLRFEDLDLLRTHVSAWSGQANRHKRKIHWRFRKADARKKFSYRARAMRRLPATKTQA
jgi:transposase